LSYFYQELNKALDLRRSSRSTSKKTSYSE